jgi:bifunctional pyridoxal-dependent enzyme with beta-cystathionase and maltose regulon repressor activities
VTQFFKLRLTQNNQYSIHVLFRIDWTVTRGLAFGYEGEGIAWLNIAGPRSKLKVALDQLGTAILSPK